MLDIIAIFLVLGGQLSNKHVTAYIDNSNSRDVLVREYTDTKAVGEMVQLFWAHVRPIGVLVWVELIPSGVNPAEKPTRDSPPHPAKQTRKFGILEALRVWIYSQLDTEVTPRQHAFGESDGRTGRSHVFSSL